MGACSVAHAVVELCDVARAARQVANQLNQLWNSPWPTSGYRCGFDHGDGVWWLRVLARQLGSPNRLWFGHRCAHRCILSATHFGAGNNDNFGQGRLVVAKVARPNFA